MFAEAFFVFIVLFSSGTTALSLFSALSGPVSPYIGSIPALAKAGTSLSALNESAGGLLGGKFKYSNGFFWPPPPAVAASALQSKLLSSDGLQGLGLGGLGLSGLALSELGLGGLGLSGLGLNGLGAAGLIGSGLGLGGGLQVIRIPLPSSSATAQQCPALCFPCSPGTSPAGPYFLLK